MKQKCGNRKILSIVGAILLMFSASMTAYAKPEVMKDGAIFDAQYYAKTYPDVAEEFGTEAEMLYEHYKLFGQGEGRSAVALETEVSEITSAKEAAVERKIAEDGAVYGAQIIELVNTERKYEGVDSLEYDLGLSTIAAGRARELAKSFSHIRPDGTTVSAYMTEEAGARYAGENIAMGQTLAGQVMTDWMNSKSHRNNILYKKYTKIGVGYYRDEKGKNYWCQIFSSDY